MKKRESGVQLLRIVSMLFIVCYHFLYWGGVLDNAPLFSGVYFYSWTVNAHVHVMVNVFVLITGYYMVTSKVKAKSVRRFSPFLQDVPWQERCTRSWCRSSQKQNCLRNLQTV